MHPVLEADRNRAFDEGHAFENGASFDARGRGII
jgi:hypothetical protein